MKASLVAAALLGGATAHIHRRGHEIFHKRSNDTEVCIPGCTTQYTTITGDFIWQPTPNAPAKVVSSSAGTTRASSVPVTKSATAALTSSVASTPAVVPTPIAQPVSTPGTYTFPATTMTVTETTSVVAATTTTVTSGTYTLGGVTTVVETATTVVCPFATVSTQSGGVVTSVIQTTTYVCPAAGTYTIAPTTVTVTAATETVTVPVVTTYLPGTYTAPAVTTVISTETVVYCPFASSEAAAPTTTSAAVPTTSVVAPTSSVAAVTSVASATIVPVASSAPAVASSAVASSAVASSAVSSSAVSSSAAASSTASLGSSGNKWAMTYTPYDSDTGDCKTADAVDADVASIAASGFSVLRVYSTDCDTLPNVGSAAAKYGVRMIVGIFISEVGCANGSPDVDDQISALKNWGEWDLVDLLAVGNEALYDGYCTPQELVDLINHVKSELPDYLGPYTTTDIVSAWQEEEVQSVVCDAVDVVAANVHSYFSANVAPADAGEFVKGQIEIVEQACGGKTGYVLECGYPTSGVTNGLNVPSAANQKIAITSIQEIIGDRVVFFSMFNDQWKAPGVCECERFWGVGDLFGALGQGDNE